VTLLAFLPTVLCLNYVYYFRILEIFCITINICFSNRNLPHFFNYLRNIFFENYIFTIYHTNVAPLDSLRRTPLIARYCLTFYTWAEVCKNWLVIFCLIEFNRSFDTTICSSCHVCWVRTYISIKTKTKTLRYSFEFRIDILFIIYPCSVLSLVKSVLWTHYFS